MKHINLSNYKGSITDWTILNYVKGGLVDNLADIVNIKVNDSCYNYLAKSSNLIWLDDVAETTTNGITWKIQNGTIYLNGTASAYFSINLLVYCQVTSDVTLKFFDIQGTSSKSSIVRVNDTYQAPTTTGSYYSTITTFVLYTDATHSFTNYQIKPMLVRGSTAPTAYEPYGALVIHQNAGKIPFTDLDFTRVSTPEQGAFRVEIEDLGVKIPGNQVIPNASIKGYTAYPWAPLSTDNDGKFGYGMRASTQKLTLAIVDKNYINDLDGFIQANSNNNFIAELANPTIIVVDESGEIVSTTTITRTANTLAMSNDAFELDNTTDEVSVEQDSTSMIEPDLEEES